MIKRIFDGRKKIFFAEITVAVLALLGLIYYAVQSNIDKCFSIPYFVFLTMGFAAIMLHAFLRYDFLTVISSVCFGIALGFIIYDMLPSLSDVWNGVTFIGGNLTAYLIYTAYTLVFTVVIIVCSFLGTDKEEN